MGVHILIPYLLAPFEIGLEILLNKFTLYYFLYFSGSRKTLVKNRILSQTINVAISINHKTVVLPIIISRSFCFTEFIKKLPNNVGETKNPATAGL